MSPFFFFKEFCINLISKAHIHDIFFDFVNRARFSAFLVIRKDYFHFVVNFIWFHVRMKEKHSSWSLSNHISPDLLRTNLNKLALYSFIVTESLFPIFQQFHTSKTENFKEKRQTWSSVNQIFLNLLQKYFISFYLRSLEAFFFCKLRDLENVKFILFFSGNVFFKKAKKRSVRHSLTRAGFDRSDVTSFLATSVVWISLKVEMKVVFICHYCFYVSSLYF